jgi:hypothetical protein
MAEQPLSHVTEKCGRQHSNSGASKPVQTYHRRIEGSGFRGFDPRDTGKRNAALNVFWTMQRNFCNRKSQKLSWQFSSKGVRTSSSKVRSETNVAYKLKTYLRSFGYGLVRKPLISLSQQSSRHAPLRRGLACSVDRRLAVPRMRVR